MQFDLNELQRIRDRQSHRFATSHYRTATTRGRSLEQGVHLTQLKTLAGRQLRILSATNGAGEEHIGKFWFVSGYSRVGGPDLVPET